MTRPLAILLAASLAAATAACSSPPAPRDTFYRLEAGVPARGFDTPALPGVLEVNRLDTDGVLSERALAYAEPGRGIQRYRYDFWSEPPGLLLQDRLVQALTAAKAAAKVVTPDLRVPPDYALRGKVRRFEQIAGANQVAVDIQLVLVDARNGELIMMETYSARPAAAGDSAEAAVAAIGRGVDEVVARFLADLAKADIPAPRR
ncbi:MAG: ABC-type transport auxiliary lipoprotein family protein [Pseudomonadota bacterium]